MTCRLPGIVVGGADCGYLDADDVVCTELNAAHRTERCRGLEGKAEKECLWYHARWAINACYPDVDANETVLRNYDRCTGWRKVAAPQRNRRGHGVSWNPKVSHPKRQKSSSVAEPADDCGFGDVGFLTWHGDKRR